MSVLLSERLKVVPSMPLPSAVVPIYVWLMSLCSFRFNCQLLAVSFWLLAVRCEWFVVRSPISQCPDALVAAFHLPPFFVVVHCLFCSVRRNKWWNNCSLQSERKAETERRRRNNRSLRGGRKRAAGRRTETERRERQR